MKTRLIIFTLILGVLLIGSVSAGCTVTLGKSDYNPGETVTATASCTAGNEKSQSYTLSWFNITGTGMQSIENDTGTTPSTPGQNFFETFVLPSGFVAGNNISANLTGTGLEGSDQSTVSAAGTNELVITNIGFTAADDIRVGKTLGIEFEVDDENTKQISNAQCEVDLEDGIGNPLASKEMVTHAGKGDVEFLLNSETFDEDRSYLVAIRCFCGSANNSLDCINEDGNPTTNRIGSDNSAFEIVKWLTVNTVTDKTLYEMKKTIFICSNLSNQHNDSFNTHIFYQARCSTGNDNDDDVDRSLIISDGVDFDNRRISNGTTQMQCKEFLVPEIRHLEGRNSQCYASTNTWVMSDSYKKIKGYHTTSPVFNISSTELNIPADWERTANYTFNTVINLTASKYSDWNGTGTGNIDIIIDSSSGEMFDSRNTRSSPTISLQSLFLSNQLKEITATNASDANITNALEFLEDGRVEIELRDVDISQSGWYNVTLVFNKFEERSVEALEGIENKTGTFHLDVDCPSTGTVGSDMDCTITAYIEDQQIVQKEVDFTCYISDGTIHYSSNNFNQMITRNAVSIKRSFAIPSGFNSGQQYVLQCHADYYNFGSRRDSFYDTFTADTEGGGILVDREDETGRAQITGGAVDEGEGEDDGGILEKFNPFSPNRNWALILIGAIVIFGVARLIFLCVRKRKQDKYYTLHKTSWKKIFGRIFLILLGLVILGGVIAGVIYGYGYVKKGVSSLSQPGSYSILQDGLFRGIILTAFIVLMIIILFKVLNLRGEIKFGHDYYTRKHNEDRKSAKLQQELNQIMLKNEIKREKMKKNHKVRKITQKEFEELMRRKGRS